MYVSKRISVRKNDSEKEKDRKVSSIQEKNVKLNNNNNNEKGNKIVFPYIITYHNII